jgi:hypothetical protein
VSDAIRQASADFGVQSPTFTLFAYRDQDVIIAKRAAWRGERPDQSSNTFPCNLCAETDAGVVLLRLGPGWFDDTVFPRRQVGRATVTHEIYHIFQIDALRGKNYDPARGPAWLLEGSAQWLAYRVMSAQLGTAWDTVLSTERERMRSDSSSLQSLEDLGVFARSAAPYSLGLTAVDLLVEGRTLGDIAMFYRQLGQGEPWQAAFASAFGTSPGEFYEKFATFRAAH